MSMFGATGKCCSVATGHCTPQRGQYAAGVAVVSDCALRHERDTCKLCCCRFCSPGSEILRQWYLHGARMSVSGGYRQVLPSGVTQVIVHPSEASMLQGWLDWLRNADPDVLNVFQASPSPSWSVTAVLQPSGLNIRDSSLVVRHNMAPSRHVRCAVPGLAGAA